MPEKIIYQTLEDRGNPEEVEKQGPFECNRHNAWAGRGYYFWDTFISSAHWWGAKNLAVSYVICQGVFDFNERTCYDLVGNTDHMEDFHKSVQILKKKKLIDHTTTFAKVMEFVKLIGFDFPAIRLYGVNSKSRKKNKSIFYLTESGTQYIDYRPVIQICIYDLKNIGFSEFKIIYPSHYIQNYVV